MQGWAAGYTGLGCGFAVSEDELERSAGWELDSQEPSFLTALENTVLLAVDTQQPMRLGVANFLESGLHSVDLLCVDWLRWRGLTCLHCILCWGMLGTSNCGKFVRIGKNTTFYNNSSQSEVLMLDKIKYVCYNGCIS